MFKTSRVFPTDLNDHNTLFGGKILAEMDMVASISATRHARKECVTASMDWVDFYIQFALQIVLVMNPS